MVVKEWEEALGEVSSLKGWESEKIDNGFFPGKGIEALSLILWNKEEAKYVLDNNKGTSKIEALQIGNA
ncbi:hypothetical protein NL676_010876 [Syzygium grande]|nr:hypothetical protein NL676_010876 [Syzygium grande]